MLVQLRQETPALLAMLAVAAVAAVAAADMDQSIALAADPASLVVLVLLLV